MSANEIAARSGAIAGTARALEGVRGDLAGIASAVSGTTGTTTWDGSAGARFSALVSAWSADLRRVGGEVGGTIGALDAWARDLAATELRHEGAIGAVGARLDGDAGGSGASGDDPDFGVLIDSLRELSLVLGTATDRIEERLDTLQGKVDRLRGEWTGRAQRAYDGAQAEWLADLGEMRDILREIAAMTDDLASGYVATDTAAARRFE